MPTIVRPLRPDDARQAYALIHLADGSCSLDDWLAFVQGKPHGAPLFKAGVMTAHGPADMILGLFAYKTSVGRPSRRLLIIHHYVAFDLFGHGSTAQALLAAMDELADRLHCDAIRLELPASHLRGRSLSADILPQPLVSAGYCPAGLTASKPVGPARPA